MSNKWIVVILALIVGFVGGVVTSKIKGEKLTHGEKVEEALHHAHTEPYDVPEGVPAPTVNLTVYEDPKSGYNLHIETTNFTFAPEHASQEAVMGEGHAHVYVDGEKINRVYGNWYYLGSVGGVGEHEVRVDLNANDHRPYTVNGVKVESVHSVVVEPKASFDAGGAVEHSLSIAERTLTPSVVTVNEGDSVRLAVNTDEAGEFHIAGYEIVTDMTAADGATVEFIADKAGRYNIELHPSESGMHMEIEGEMEMHDGMAMDADAHMEHGEDIEIGALVVNPR